MDAYRIIRDALATAGATEALAALAELEKASKEPVATLVGFDVETGLPVDIAWHADCATFNSGDKLYTTPPPAPVAPGMFTAKEMRSAWMDGRAFGGDIADSRTEKFIQERTK